MVWSKEKVQLSTQMDLNTVASERQIKCMAVVFLLISMVKYAMKENSLKENFMELVFSIMILNKRKNLDQYLIIMILVNLKILGLSIVGNFLMIKEKDKVSCFWAMGKSLWECFKMIWFLVMASIFWTMVRLLLDYGGQINLCLNNDFHFFFAYYKLYKIIKIFVLFSKTFWKSCSSLIRQ